MGVPNLLYYMALQLLVNLLVLSVLLRSAHAASAWHMGAVGGSCTDACSAVSKSCVAADFATANANDATGAPGTGLVAVINAAGGSTDDVRKRNQTRVPCPARALNDLRNKAPSC